MKGGEREMEGGEGKWRGGTREVQGRWRGGAREVEGGIFFFGDRQVLTCQKQSKKGI